MQNTKNLLQEYISLKNDIKLLQEREKQLKPLMIKLLKLNGYKSITTDMGTISLRQDKLWEFPKSLTTKIQSYKEKISTMQNTWKASNPHKYTQPEDLYTIVFKGR